MPAHTCIGLELGFFISLGDVVAGPLAEDLEAFWARAEGEA